MAQVSSHNRQHQQGQIAYKPISWLGDMSLVGPRPAVPKEVEQYEFDQRRRLDAIPGITGLQQAVFPKLLNFVGLIVGAAGILTKQLTMRKIARIVPNTVVDME